MPPCNVLPHLHIWSRHMTAHGRLSNGRGPIIAEGVYVPRILVPLLRPTPRRNPDSFQGVRARPAAIRALGDARSKRALASVGATMKMAIVYLTNPTWRT